MYYHMVSNIMLKSSEIDYSTINVIIAMDNPVLRRGMLDSLKKWGFQDVSEAMSYAQLHNQLENGAPDLILAITELNGFSVSQLVRELRNGRLGPHPFPVVILLLPEANHDLVMKVVDCGADDLLLMPVSAAQLLSRIAVLTRGRKPFIVTQDYQGPERRTPQQYGGEEIPMGDVPNPLAAKAGRVAPAVLQRDIEFAIQQLNTIKVERHAMQIQWLMDAILNGCRSGKVGSRILLHQTRELREIAKDLERRTEEWQNNAIFACSEQLTLATTAFEAAGTAVGSQELAGLAQAAGLILSEIRQTLASRAALGTHRSNKFPDSAEAARQGRN